MNRSTGFDPSSPRLGYMAPSGSRQSYSGKPSKLLLAQGIDAFLNMHCRVGHATRRFGSREEETVLQTAGPTFVVQKLEHVRNLHVPSPRNMYDSSLRLLAGLQPVQKLVTSRTPACRQKLQAWNQLPGKDSSQVPTILPQAVSTVINFL